MNPTPSVWKLRKQEEREKRKKPKHNFVFSQIDAQNQSSKTLLSSLTQRRIQKPNLHFCFVYSHFRSDLKRFVQNFVSFALTESNKSEQGSKRKSEREQQRAYLIRNFPGKSVRKCEKIFKERERRLWILVCANESSKSGCFFFLFVQIEKNGVRNGIFVIMRTSRGIFELCVFGLEPLFLYGVAQE